MIKAIVTKTGNSYALRVPKRYIDDNALKLGDEVEIEEPIDQQQKAIRELVQLSKKRGPIKSIKDPVAWQRAQRQSSDPWDEVKRDFSR
jgi:antitoxin component of MazEF toxin-antitoxin module